MNKTLISLAISSVMMMTNAYADGIQSGNKEGSTVYSAKGTSLEIGGRAEARLSLKDGKAADASRARLNFKGTAAINDNLYGVGFYEGELKTSENADKDIDNRYVYAGIGGNFGEVTYGKNDGALGVITDFTDIMSYHGNTAAYKLAVADRTTNMLTYKAEANDLSVKASYRFADRTIEGELNNDGTINPKTAEFGDNDKDGYSLSGIYAFGQSGLKLGLGYADQDSVNEYMVGASYEIANVYLAGLFTDADFDGLDYTGYEFAAGYKLGKAAFTTTYNNAEFEDETIADNVAVDAAYYFKPNFRTYISYNFNLLDSDEVGKVASEDELALGLRYDF